MLDWLPLFEHTNFYEEFYKWFDILKAKNIILVGYVLMPNHAHFLIYVPESSSILNKIIANGKRFMAYEIVRRLKRSESAQLLKDLEEAVPDNEKKKGKLHQVFTPSFDAKPCFTESFLIQKLEYIHKNRLKGNGI
jgi:REP element-mobilizing transposase RayT